MSFSYIARFLTALLLLTSVTHGADEMCNQQNGLCYKAVSRQLLDWNRAQDYCIRNFPSGSLASIHSGFENSLILSAILEAGQPNPQIAPWIGGYRGESDSTFSWSDGTAFQYANWATDYPAPRGSQCIKFCYSSSNCQPLRWKTAPCNTDSSFVCEYQRIPSTTLSPTPPAVMEDCYDWLHIAGRRTSGLYTIHPPRVQSAFTVYCDMETDGGGWTLFHRRQDISLAFETYLWNDYKVGFQNKNYTNYWMGLDRLHVMSTIDDIVDLRVDIAGDRRPESNCASCTWSLTAPFTIGNELTNYKLALSPSAAGSIIPLYYHNGMQFSTIDKDNDAWPNNCAQAYHSGGWWFNACFAINLNGRYDPTAFNCPSNTYSYCYTNGGSWNQPRYPGNSEMKLRKRVIPRDGH